MKLSSKKAALEQQLAQIEKELKTIERSAAFKKENAIRRALDNIMSRHGCVKADLIAILQSDTILTKTSRANNKRGERKTRKLKVFMNPHTNEVVETRSNNHKTLKAWKTQYKVSNIDDWLVDSKA